MAFVCVCVCVRFFAGIFIHSDEAKTEEPFPILNASSFCSCVKVVSLLSSTHLLNRVLTGQPFGVYVWILGGNASLCIFEFLWMLKWSSVAVIWLQLEWLALTKCNWIHKCNLNTICYNWFCPDEQTAFKIDMEDRYCLLGFHEIDSFICLFIFISWQHIWEMWKGGGVCGPGDGVSPARNGDVKGCLMTVQMPVDLRVKCCCEVRLCPCVMAVDRSSAQFFNLLCANEMGNSRFWVNTVWENSLGLWKLPRLSLILNFEMPCFVLFPILGFGVNREIGVKNVCNMFGACWVGWDLVLGGLEPHVEVGGGGGGC